MSFNHEQKRQIIMAHYLEPEYKKILDNNKITRHGKACADYLEFSFEINNNKINNLYFDAKGCAFMIASTDLICKELNGKSVDEASNFIEKYESFIKNGGDNSIENELGELAIFNNVKEHPNRYYCATLLSSALKEELNV
ncbi:iron-sulfur cluster assembly scaffold protein [Mycoplasma miroungigenitalium]|nr:iron-sulfur cluster assembly scaffold protein [Mycoplasma miroungigenitalium]